MELKLSKFSTGSLQDDYSYLGVSAGRGRAAESPFLFPHSISNKQSSCKELVEIKMKAD
jgi:hypothetical protein